MNIENFHFFFGGGYRYIYTCTYLLDRDDVYPESNHTISISATNSSLIWIREAQYIPSIISQILRVRVELRLDPQNGSLVESDIIGVRIAQARLPIPVAGSPRIPPVVVLRVLAGCHVEVEIAV